MTKARKVIGDTFKQQLERLRSLARDLNDAQLSEENAAEVKAQLEQYGLLNTRLDSLELSGAQKSELRQVRSDLSDERRRFIRRMANTLIDSKARRENNQKEELLRREAVANEALKGAKELFPEFKKAARHFLDGNLKNTNALDLTERAKKYRELRRQLSDFVERLEPTARLEALKIMTGLSQKVNQHEYAISRELEQVKQVITAATQKADSNVKEMTVAQMVFSILPAATQQDILRIIGPEGVRAIEAGVAVTQDNIGTLALSRLPEQAQLALITNLISEAAKLSGQEIVPLAQFIQAVEKDIKGLLSGEKTHLSLVYEVNGFVQSIHVDVSELLRHPEIVIPTIIFEMFKAGAAHDSRVIMALSSPVEVAALLQIKGMDMQALPGNATLPDLAGQLIVAAPNASALSQILHRNVTSGEITSIMTGLGKAKAREGLKPAELFKFLQAIAILIEAGRILSMPAVKPEKGIDLLLDPSKDKQKLLMQSPFGMQFGGLNLIAGPTPGTNTKPLQLEFPVKPNDVSTLNIDLMREHQRFYELMNRLDDLHASLVNKKYPGDTTNPNLKYATAVESVYNLIGNLEDYSEAFFTKPTPERFAEFKSKCNEAFASTAAELKQHRGVWDQLSPILKGFIGVLATLTVVPALIISLATKRGYVDTFFTTPAPVSANTLAEIESDMLTNQNDLGSKLISVKAG